MVGVKGYIRAQWKCLIPTEELHEDNLHVLNGGYTAVFSFSVTDALLSFLCYNTTACCNYRVSAGQHWPNQNTSSRHHWSFDIPLPRAIVQP